MITPGIDFLGRTVLCAGSLYLVTISFARFTSALSFPPWILLLGASISLPIAFALRVLYVDLIHCRQATRMGARLAPLVKGKQFGNIDFMLNMVEQVKNGYPGDGWIEPIAKLGTCFNFHIMYEDLIFTVEPGHIKTILASDFEKLWDKFQNTMSSVLGTGVFNSDGDMWKFHRSMTRPFFSHDRIGHFNIFDRHAEDAIARMKSRFRAGHPVDFQDVMSRFTLDSASEFLFGNCVHSLSAGLNYPYNIAPAEAPTGKAKAAEDFARAFAQAQSIISRRPLKGWTWPLFEIFKDDTKEPMQIVNSFIDPILKEAIAKKQSAEASGEK
ncbi:cytochrome P450, partial [Rhizopogon vinicolor AM-OR11-026]